MKKYTSKIIVATVCAVLVVIGGVSAYAVNDKSAEKPQVEAVSVEETAPQSEGITKDETVYVIAGADGSVQKIIVSDWLKNSIGSNCINDVSELENAENVKNDETYTKDNGTIVWNAEGKDIYYTGNIEKELPVDMTVTYILDGKEVSPSELAGKSGKLIIRYNYQNNLYENVEIGGSTEKIYVPFVAVSGLLLDSDVFTNVEVSSGKVLNDGNHTVVAGIAFPGLQSSLGIDSDKLKIPEYVEITADVQNFELSNTLTIVTNSVFNNLDTDKLNSMGDINSSLDELTDGMSKLLDGSSQLYDGLCTLLDKSDELVAGINTLADGASQLSDGAKALDAGASDLSDGTEQLKAGLDTLSANSDALNSGSKEVFLSLLSMADSKLSEAGIDAPKLTIENYNTMLDGVMDNLNEDMVYNTALAKVTASVNERKDEIEQAVTAAIRDEVTAKVLSAMNMTVETYNAGVQAGMITAQQQAQIKAAVDAQMETKEIKAMVEVKTDEQISILIEQYMNSDEVKNQIEAGKKQAEDGVESIKALKAQLDSYNEFYTGLAAYTNGVDAAKAGADALNSGAKLLADGAKALNGGMAELYGGIDEMKKASPELINGITELRDGSLTLSEGLIQFNEQGVQKLVDAVEGDLSGLIERINAVKSVSEHYRSFSGISEEMDGEVKFIYRTDEISLN